MPGPSGYPTFSVHIPMCGYTAYKSGKIGNNYDKQVPESESFIFMSLSSRRKGDLEKNNGLNYRYSLSLA